jgi:uncharacterized protein (DUF2252 family)
MSKTLQSDRRHLLDQFVLTDIAQKVWGLGSVGTRAWILLLEAGVEGEALLLQAKEADRRRSQATQANRSTATRESGWLPVST